MSEVNTCCTFRLPEELLKVLMASTKPYQQTSFDMENPPFGYDYQNFTLEALIFKARIDSGCMEELLLRLSRLIGQIAHDYCRYHRQASLSEVKTKLIKTVQHSVLIYNPDKGNFEHLLRRMIHNALRYYESDLTRRNVRDKMLFERNLITTNMSDALYSEDSCPPTECDMSEQIKLDLDLQQYLSLLSPLERQIMMMHMQGYSYRQISSLLTVPLSTVEDYLGTMLSELKQRQKRHLL